MISRRELLTTSVPAVAALSGCTARSITGPTLARSLGFRRTERFLTDQPSLDSERQTVASVLIDDSNAESVVDDWGVLLDSSSEPYRETEYAEEFLVVHVGVVDRGRQISVGRPRIQDGWLSYDVSVVSGSMDPPDTDESIFSYRIEQWTKGPMFSPKGVSSSLRE
jgi:hypothetical protein